MQYQTVRQGRFLSRPNRFIARVELDGAEETVHVKNTGRCRELLIPGATVYLAEGESPNRKTRYDLIAVEKGSLLVNMDSQATNRVFGEWAGAGQFRTGLTLLRPETVWGNSRFDFYWEDAAGHKGFVEVKGVTLEENGHARFPDAPTLRGVKHLEELTLLPRPRLRSRRLLCPADGRHDRFCAQRRHPLRLRGCPAPGCCPRGGGTGHGMCRDAGQPDHRRPGSRAAVRGKLVKVCFSRKIQKAPGRDGTVTHLCARFRADFILFRDVRVSSGLPGVRISVSAYFCAGGTARDGVFPRQCGGSSRTRRLPGEEQPLHLQR